MSAADVRAHAPPHTCPQMSRRSGATNSKVTTAEQCGRYCMADPMCFYFTFKVVTFHPRCFLKSVRAEKEPLKCPATEQMCVSGIVHRDARAELGRAAPPSPAFPPSPTLPPMR